MIKSEIKKKELANVLKNDSSILVKEAIELLRHEKPFEGAIGILTAFYDTSNDFSIRKTIEGFMNDLKEQSVCEEVIVEIRKQWKSDTISMLVSSCWQSGLNYSAYSPDLAKVFLEGDYVTAVECLTVIEESANEMTRSEKDEIIKILEDNPIALNSEKNSLMHELLFILER
jgi:hypothetical protein